MTGKRNKGPKDDKQSTKQSQDEATTQSETRSQTDKPADDKPEGYVFGRPSLYQPEFCEKILEYASQGFSLSKIATLLQVHRHTLERWANAHDDFRDAYARARDAITTYYEDRYANADLVKENDPRPQEGLIKFLMIGKCASYREIFNPPKEKPEPPVINVTFQAPEPKDK